MSSGLRRTPGWLPLPLRFLTATSTSPRHHGHRMWQTRLRLIRINLQYTAFASHQDEVTSFPGHRIFVSNHIAFSLRRWPTPHRRHNYSNMCACVPRCRLTLGRKRLIMVLELLWTLRRHLLTVIQWWSSTSPVQHPIHFCLGRPAPQSITGTVRFGYGVLL